MPIDYIARQNGRRPFWGDKSEPIGKPGSVEDDHSSATDVTVRL